MIGTPSLRALAPFLAAASLVACGGTSDEPVIPPFTVIGQASFQANQANQGGAVAANTLKTPLGNVAVAEDGTLFVADTFNARVLGFRQIPESNNARADFVVGKASLDSAVGSPDPSASLAVPLSVSTATGRMAISDGYRVVIHAVIPTTDGAAAAVVVGQSGFSVNVSAGCIQAGLLNAHSAVLTPNGKLVVADSGHNRVMIWNTVPQTHGQPANVVLGQPDFVQCDENTGSNPDARTLAGPFGLWSDGQRLIVADTDNHRVLIWNQMPVDSSQNFTPADIVLGQTSMTGNVRNDANGDGTEDGAPAATSMRFPQEVHSDGQRLAITDSGNNRVLIWNTIPTRSATPPDRVIGQPEFNHGAANDVNRDGVEDAAPSELVLKNPRGVFLHGKRLFVTDAGNHRVLVIRLD